MVTNRPCPFTNGSNKTQIFYKLLFINQRVRRMFFLAGVFVFLFSGITNLNCIGQKNAPENVKMTGLYILRSGDYQKSVNYYQRQLNNYPEDEVIMNYLAVSYTGLGKYKDAEKVYVNMLKLNPENKSGRAGLFNLYNAIINRAVASKNYNLAFDYVKKGEHYIPDNSNFYLLDAELNVNLSNFYEAAAMYKLSWEIDYRKTDNIINVWKLRRAGELHFRLGKPYTEDWRNFVTDILKKDQDNRDLLNLMADAYFFNNENLQKRNKLKNRAMELYQKESGNRPNIELDFPLRGRYKITSGYFQTLFDTHNGYDGYCLDFVAIDENGGRIKGGETGVRASLSFGKPIFAAYDGVVEKVCDVNKDNDIGEHNYFTSNFVKMRHEKDGRFFYTIYYHIKKGSLKVSSGSKIKAGTQIAEIGNSGYSFGAHLHFGLYDNNNVSLPLNFVDVQIEGKQLKKDMKINCDMVFICKDKIDEKNDDDSDNIQIGDVAVE